MSTEVHAPQKNRWVRHTECGTFDVPIDDVWALVQEINLEDVAGAYPDLPKVTGTRPVSGEWNQVGDSRIVDFSTGDTALETITEYEPPHRFGYQLTEFTLSLRFAARRAGGLFVYEDLGHGRTGVTWTYTFVQKHWVGKIIIRNYVKKTHQYWMRDVLASTKRQLEEKYNGA